MIRRIGALLMALTACRPRAARETGEAGTQSATQGGAPEERALPTEPLVVPVRAAEGSQPRWRYLARGERPRGRERWRVDVTPKEPYGEPATDGRTVYVSIVRQELESPTAGEVLALDVRDGTLRWRAPVAGLHGEPVELVGDVVLLDTVAHCTRRAAETPGVPLRRCEAMDPGGVVGLDPATGRQRFRTAVSSEALRARWTAAELRGSLWIHDGSSALRALTPPVGTLGPRLNLNASVSSVLAAQADLVLTLVGRSGLARIQRRSPASARPVWDRPLPAQTRCPPLLFGHSIVLPAFYSGAISGAPRALHAATGADLWIDEPPLRSAPTCGAIEGGVFWQVIDDRLVGLGASDGHTRARHPLPFAPTHDLTGLINGVFFASAPGRLAGVDVSDGSLVFSLETGARACEGMMLWGGLGVALTREPGLVVGFE